MNLSGVPQKFQAFLSRLKGVVSSPTKNRWYACCPAHEDERPSLSVSIGDKGNLVVCCNSPSACTAKAITEAVGLTLADLFLEDRPDFKGVRKVRHPSATYQYIGLDGRVAYETCRYNDPKDFRQRRPNPLWRMGSDQPRYHWDLDGVELIPYRLPQLVESASTPDRWVHLVEGEKCADSMAALGCISTTHAMGSAHWYDLYAKWFTGRLVVIWYDVDPWNDKQRKRPGQEWAIQAARSIYRVAKEVKVCRPPGIPDDSKGDVADYILANKGQSADQLRRNLFDVIKITSSYFPGWEHLNGFTAQMMAYYQSIAANGVPGNMNDALEDVGRKISAAINGVRLTSMTTDLANTAAWCLWLASTVNPSLLKPTIVLGDSPKTSEVKPDEAQSTAQTQNAIEAHPVGTTCLPTQQAEAEPEVI